MSDRTLIMVLLGATSFVVGLVSYATGVNAHRSDYQSGWTAGFAAREQQVQDENARFAGAGLCTLAAFSCDTHYKSKDPHR